MWDINYRKLTHHDPLIRKSGAQALFRKSSLKDLQKLQNALILEQDPRVIKWLAYTLAKIGDISSLEFLKLKVVENEDARDWIMVSRAILLEAIKGKPDLRYIQQLLSSQSVDAQKKGAVLSWHIRDLPEDVKEKLLKQLNYEDKRVRI